MGGAEGAQCGHWNSRKFLSYRLPNMRASHRSFSLSALKDGWSAGGRARARHKDTKMAPDPETVVNIVRLSGPQRWSQRTAPRVTFASFVTLGER